MKAIRPQEIHYAAPLLQQIPHHTLLRTLLSGQTRGHIYLDQIEAPTLAFAQFRHRAYLCGAPRASLEIPLRAFFQETIFENCRTAGVPLFRLTVSNPGWLGVVTKALADLEPITEGYQCYQLDLDAPRPDPVPPEGFELRKVNQALTQTDFPGREDLLEEMCSERDSVETFLAQSFGIVAFKEGVLAGWCLSEYNHADQCEIGIGTQSPFQRQGVAKAMTAAFLRLAQVHGIRTVLWHCYQSNLPSRKTALSAGFHLAADEQVLELYLNPGINLAVHGNHALRAGNYSEALDWYRKALAYENEEDWMALNAARVAAQLGEVDLAFDYLRQALDLGFDNREYLTHHPQLAALRSDPRWEGLLARSSGQ